jgi:hypothetical protein
VFTVEHEVNVDMVCLLWESGGIIVQLDTAATLGLWDGGCVSGISDLKHP